MFQKAFIHKSYVSASYADDETIKKNEKYYGKLDKVKITESTSGSVAQIK